MKKCSNCNEVKSFSNFYSCKRNKTGYTSYCKKCNDKKSSESYHRNKTLKPKITPNTKTCSRCKEEFPRNREFFFQKKYKQKLATGELKIYYSFRHVCKKCHAKNCKEKTRKKRCKELNCKESEYQKAWRDSMAYKKTKYKFLAELKIPINYHETIKNWIRSGYDFSTIDQFLKDREELKRKTFESRRKQSLPKGYKYVKDLPEDLKREYKRKILPDSKMANWLGMKVKDCPKEMIEAKRMTYLINRLIEDIE